MYNECIYVCLLPVYREVFLPIVFFNKLLKLFVFIQVSILLYKYTRLQLNGSCFTCKLSTYKEYIVLIFYEMHTMISRETLNKTSYSNTIQHQHTVVLFSSHQSYEMLISFCDEGFNCKSISLCTFVHVNSKLIKTYLSLNLYFPIQHGRKSYTLSTNRDRKGISTLKYS